MLESTPLSTPFLLIFTEIESDLRRKDTILIKQEAALPVKRSSVRVPLSMS